MPETMKADLSLRSSISTSELKIRICTVIQGTIKLELTAKGDKRTARLEEGSGFRVRDGETCLVEYVAGGMEEDGKAEEAVVEVFTLL